MIRLLLATMLASIAPVFASTGAGDVPVVWSGAVELPDGSKLAFSVELTKDGGTITIPMQNAKDVPLSGVSATGKELKFSVASAGAAWELDVAQDGQSAVGVLIQGGGRFKATLRRLGAGASVVKQFKRPQEPKPPLPYSTLEIAVPNELASVTLAGTLSLPAGKAPFPCAVLVTGSGPQDRDESLMGHRPFLVIADHLTRQGIAVLRYDDRGVAHSTGRFEVATSDDFADDALAAVAFLKSVPEIDARAIGIVGHSEGGLIAPICAARSKDVAFVVLLAGTGMTGLELMPMQTRAGSLLAGMSAADADRAAKEAAELYSMLVAGKDGAELKDRIRAAVIRQLKATPDTRNSSEAELAEQAESLAAQQAEEVTSPWFRRFLVIDPREHLRKVQCPVLALNGERDMQVPPKENLPRIERALREGGNPDVTIVEFPGLNHLFQTCTTGAPSEYSEIEETFSPVVLERMASWILERTRRH